MITGHGLISTGNSCDVADDNTGHGLISTGNSCEVAADNRTWTNINKEQL
jgi:hypothetical protein